MAKDKRAKGDRMSADSRLRSERYGWSLIALHWLTLLVIAAAYILGTILDDMALSPLKLKFYAWHKWLGLLVLTAVPLRLGLRMVDKVDHAGSLLPWEAKLSTWVQRAIYLLMVVAPCLGWLLSSASGFQVVWFGVLPLPELVPKDKALASLLKELHETGVNILMALIVLHAAAALYHRYIRQDGVMARMVPRIRRNT